MTYVDLGCWKDTNDRALNRLEGRSQCNLNDKYQDRQNPLVKCRQCAQKHGFVIFAVQNGGECWAARDNDSYKKHGSSTSCRSDGEGGRWANNVYKIGMCIDLTVLSYAARQLCYTRIHILLQQIFILS